MSTSLTHCRNCGHRLFAWDKFCSQCGQDTLDHPPSLWEFVHEWVLHYLAAEGKLWKSLWALIARPGFLTLEYLAGRKQRYVLPLRLVLTLGLVFFVVVKLLPPSGKVLELPPQSAGAPVVKVVTPAESASAVAADEASDAASEAASAIHEVAQAEELITLPVSLRQQLPDAAQRALADAKTRWKADREAELRRVGNKLLAMAPYAVLCSLPFFAGLLKLLYWRLAYGAHFVFAMHLHAAWYLMLLLVTLTPWGWLHGAVWLWSNLYPLLALKRVHPAGWASTLAKASVLVVLHWMLISLGLGLMLILGALTT